MTTPAINLLQLAGIISDNCVDWDDVAMVDRDKAMAWLTVYHPELL